MRRARPRLALLVASLVAALATSGGAAPQDVPPGQGEGAAAEAPAAPAAPADPFPEVAPETVQALLDGLPDASERSAAQADLATLYEKALAYLAAAATAKQNLAEQERLIAAAPTELEEIRAELAKPPDAGDPQVPPDASLQQLEQGWLAPAEAEAKAAQAELDELEATASSRTVKRTEVPERNLERRQRVSAIETELQRAPAADEDPVVLEARRLALRAERQALLAESAASEKELAKIDARADVLPAKRDRALRRLDRARARQAFWQQVVNRYRTDNAARALAEANSVLARRDALPPEIAQLAESLAGKAKLRKAGDGVVERTNRVRELLKEQQAAFDALRKTYERLKPVVKRRSQAVGMRLRQELEKLQDLPTLRRQRRWIERELEEANFQLVTHEDERRQVGDVETEVRALREAWMDRPDAAELESLARSLVTLRNEQLNHLVKEYDDAQRHLSELADANTASIDATAEFRRYLEERILWVRSADLRNDLTPSRFVDAVQWSTAPAAWIEALRQVVADMRAQWAVTAGWIALVLSLFLLRRPLRRKAVEISQKVNSYATDSFGRTIEVLSFCLVTALPVPVLLYAAGAFLARPPRPVDVALALGDGLRWAAFALVPFTLFLEMLRPKSLAETHFRWQPKLVTALRVELHWFILVFVPVVIVVRGLDGFALEAFGNSIGRVGFIVGQVAFFVLVRRLLRPDGPVLGDALREVKGGWADRLSTLWYGFAMATPLVLVGFAAAGFYYTALEFNRLLQVSLGVLLLHAVAYALLLRWLFIARRRLAVDQARQRREARLKEAQKASEGALPESGAPVESQLDLPAINQQTLRLFRSAVAFSLVTALYLVWSDVFPALRALERVQLWPTLRIEAEVEHSPAFMTGTSAALPAASAAAQDATGAGTAAAPAQHGATAPVPGPAGALANAGLETAGEVAAPPTVFTLAKLGMLVVVILVVVIATRNVPALLEIILLQHLPLDAGARNAISSLVRYAIAISGIMVAFGAIGIGWSKVQWLAAALTFGLAFGLQEIFANFVSGIILLVERPIRIGDIVTVSGIVGRVTMIRMRATTIQDADRRELIVPNKEFITGNLVNWTLTDPVTRIVITVGIAHGSDTRLATDLLMKAANEEPNVLMDPPPSVVFRQFGTSSLDFDLRIFIADRDVWAQVMHGLHTRIDDAFRAAGIDIAFPQQELHIRSAPGLEKALKGDGLSAAPKS